MSRPARAEVTWRGDEVAEDYEQVAADSLLVVAEYVLGESNQVTPIDEGLLIASGAASVDERDLTAAVSYNTPYAVRQHEDLTARHAPGRYAKYLELTLARTSARAGKLLAVEMKRRIKAKGDVSEP